MRILSSLLILLLAVSSDAAAQNVGGVPQLSVAEIEAARASCDALGRMPNAPMSVEACKAMLSIGASLGAAAADPTAQRPGDEAMTCAAIFAELRTLAGAGISDARQAAEQAPVRAQMNEALLAGVGELGQSMQANPRFARLAQLGVSKGCEPAANAA